MFPTTDRSDTITTTLEREAKSYGVRVLSSSLVNSIEVLPPSSLPDATTAGAAHSSKL